MMSYSVFRTHLAVMGNLLHGSNLRNFIIMQLTL